MSTKLKKPLKVSNIEEIFINESIKSNLRTDGRSNVDFRNIKISFENNGHTIVQIGKTKAMGVVTCEIVEPYPERPLFGASYWWVFFTT
jgi:exosome complex component RRP45